MQQGCGMTCGGVSHDDIVIWLHNRNVAVIKERDGFTPLSRQSSCTWLDHVVNHFSGEAYISTG